ncbi:hypothetical protein GCM10027030_11430 [Luteococcus sediminum]
MNDILKDPNYGIDVIIHIPIDDLLPVLALLKILERHIGSPALTPDDLIERLLNAVVNSGSVRPDYSLIFEQHQALDADGRRQALQDILQSLNKRYGDLFFEQTNR